MPGSLDSCINSIYEPGNIPASSGTPPVRVLLKDALEATVSETATALDTTGLVLGYLATVSETATATDTQDAAPLAVARSAMLPTAYVNSDGTPRQAYVDGVMVNL